MTFEAREPAALRPIHWLDDDRAAIVGGEVTTPPGDIDPAAIVLTCANCGAPMDERTCKLFCTCGYFLSCSDYY